MAQKTFKGGASAIAQVWTTTINSSTSSQTFSITLTDESGGTATATYTAGGAETTSTVATGLRAAVAASTDPRFKAVTVGGSAAIVTLTANTSGVPFYPATGGTGSFTATSMTTPNQGPNDWNSPANWVENAIPIASDNIILDGSNAIKYGLPTGLAFGGVKSQSTFSGGVGAQGQYLSFTCTSFDWAGTGLAFVNIGSSAIAPLVRGTNSQTAPACGLYLLGSAMTTLTINGGSVDIAGGPGQTSTVTTIQLQPSTNSLPRVNVGSGVTLTNLYQQNGVSALNCAATSVIANAGTLTTFGSGTIGTIVNNGCAIISNSSGTVTTANLNAGTTDTTQSQVARTFTTVTMNFGKGAQFIFDSSVLTLTNKINGTGRMTLTSQ